MEINLLQVQKSLTEKILKKKEETEENSQIFRQLDFAFESVENLTDFTGITLEISDFFNIQGADLAKLRTNVMSDLARARAENHRFLKSTTGILAWLRNAFMSFAMWVCARSDAEKLFEQNEVTTKAMQNALGSISIRSNPPPEEPSEPPAPIGDVLPAEEAQASGEAPESFDIVDAQSQTATLEINQNIMDHLEVIDTPRDGSCMLWSVLAGLSSAELPPETSYETSANIFQRMAITDNQGRISDDKVLLARDITIPELRQVISMGMIAEGKDVSEARKIERGGFGAKRIEPEQMKYIAKYLQRDIAIITKQGGQSIAYLCTKEGGVMTSQGENFEKERFEAALQNSLAIFAQDDHARCLKYNATVGGQAT
ncbi:MAG: hypothetical protein LBD34_01630 [Puniceicoccales bacterium]|nr:hypothetical protein [Puniceicoccales bacterium]